MLDIAVHGAKENVKIKDISRRQEISIKYLEQIIAALNRAGYVKSERGPMGGYRLAKSPEDYTAGMIVRLMEGSTAPVACLQSDFKGCRRAEHCVSLILWKKIDDAVNEILDGTTLADIIKWMPEDAPALVDLPEYFI
jgi:Rrf2 family protein